MATKELIQDALCLFGYLLPYEKQISFSDWAKLVNGGDPRTQWFSAKIGALNGQIKRTYKGTATYSVNQ